MTYSILSLASGNILESYRSEEGVLEAVSRICDNEPRATETLALATFDDDGMLVEAVDGDALADLLRGLAADHHAATA